MQMENVENVFLMSVDSLAIPRHTPPPPPLPFHPHKTCYKKKKTIKPSNKINERANQDVCPLKWHTNLVLIL